MRIIFIILITLLSSPLSAQFNLNQPFEDCGVKGSITIYDYKAGKWITNDMEDSNFATLPASTFKIVNSLIALETKAVKDENEIIPWIDDYDTVKYSHRPNIYHSMSMKEAFKLSAGWAYVELAKKIGKDKYKEILSQIGYGNVDLSIDDPDFWNFGDFAISPQNQINILIGVYEETLPFTKESFTTLKEMMISEKTDSYIIRSKTGWTRDGGKDTGWWVGNIEKDNDVYFFATRLIKDRSEKNEKFGNCRKEITKEVFREMGVL
ncbi:MAG: penicillin-binding transpeptidase domain-containing protein [bacterium]|nr:penicillin-binding transpeptidase domain-containing protein [bacterium]